MRGVWAIARRLGKTDIARDVPGQAMREGQILQEAGHRWGRVFAGPLGGFRGSYCKRRAILLISG